VVLNKREKYIAIGLGGAVALMVLNFAVLAPYSAASDAATKTINDSHQTLSDFKALNDVQTALHSKWAEMQSEGVEADEPDAESQLRNAVVKWTDENQIGIQTTQPPHAQQMPMKSQAINLSIGFEVQGNRGMYAIGHLLWAIESAPIPMKVSDMQIKAVKDGQDQLSIILGVSALCMPPEPEAPANNNTPQQPATPPAGAM